MRCQSEHFLSLLYKYLFIYLCLALFGLSCVTRDFLVTDIGSFLEGRKLCSSCGIKVSVIPGQVASKILDQESNQHPLHWKADS